MGAIVEADLECQVSRDALMREVRYRGAVHPHPAGSVGRRVPRRE
jgi:hypothetical protein